MPRDPEIIGNVALSIQASRYHYCSPRVDGLPIEQYDSVEIALWEVDNDRNWIRKPSTIIETNEYDNLWDGDDVAPYVATATALALRDALRYHFGVVTS